MIFNVNQKSVKFIKNEQDIGVACSDVDTSRIYSMAISMRDNKDDWVGLRKFSIKYVS